MPPVLVRLGQGPFSAGSDQDELEYVGDLDEIVETAMCNCNAGDDNPY